MYSIVYINLELFTNENQSGKSIIRRGQEGDLGIDLWFFFYILFFLLRSAYV